MKNKNYVILLSPQIVALLRQCQLLCLDIVFSATFQRMRCTFGSVCGVTLAKLRCGHCHTSFRLAELAADN